MANQLRQRYDIIINGGGIVGFTLLKLIADSPQLNRCKVLLIEQASKPTSLVQQPRRSEDNQLRFSNRVSSITQTSESALKKLGAWTSVEQYTKDVRSIKVWNYDYSHRIVFHQNHRNFSRESSKENRDVMFSVVENNRLSLALLDSIHKQSKIGNAIAWDHALLNLTESTKNGLVDVTMSNSKTGEDIVATAQLVLGCDGYKSKVRDFSGLRYTEFNLEKTAVVGTVKMATSSSNGQPDGNEIAFQRFSAEKDTVAALLPLDKEHSSFVLSAPNEYAKHLLDCDEESFTHEFNNLLLSKESPENAILKGLHDITNVVYDNLNNLLTTACSSICKMDTSTTEHLGNDLEEPPRLDSIVTGSRAAFPLIFGTTTPKMIASLSGKQNAQLALLGDSSHRVHPLAGQGLNLGIQDALELVKQLEAVARCGEKLFDPTDPTNLDKALKRYELKRQAYIVPMSAGILSMQRLFKLMPSRFVSLVNMCDPIKSTSVKFANGC